MQYHIIPVTSFNQNCSVFWCEKSKDAIIVDPGGEKEKICTQIDLLKVNIVKIVLTHGHIDHIGGAMDLKKYYHVPILGPHKNDQFLMNDLNFQRRVLNINSVSDVERIDPDIWLFDKDQIQVGDEVFMVLHCPGHSPGHIVFWNQIRKFIIMGDVLFKKNIGRSDLPGGNYDVLIQSIKRKLLILSDDVTFLPGHGPISTIGYERKHNIFLL